MKRFEPFWIQEGNVSTCYENTSQLETLQDESNILNFTFAGMKYEKYWFTKNGKYSLTLEEYLRMHNLMQYIKNPPNKFELFYDQEV